MDRFGCRLEVKVGAGEGMLFAGYGAVFNNIDSYGDMIVPGAFAESLAAMRQPGGTWPAMLMQHGGWGMGADDLTPVGIWTDLAEDGIGLKVSGTLADTPRGREAYALLKMQPRPAIDGLSIGYVAKEWTPRSKPEEPRRTLKKIELFEVSLVTFPANPKARIDAVKAMDDAIGRIDSLSDAERLLREAGPLSRRHALEFVSRLKAIALRDAAAAGTEDVVAALRRNAAILSAT